jgi:lipopolysaccharide/colanic/teichoic acid biosynthesis glycosyltransferase
VEKEIAKRIFDLFFSTIALLILSPLLGIIAMIIKLSSPGPVFFRRQLIGQHGKPFVALKFRSMVENAHELLQKDNNLLAEYQKSLKIKKDPRVTKIGNLLRKTSLDELPQFINVFKGEMSVVGPRMLGDIEWNKYGEAKAKVLSVKPGITGLWQVSGHHEVTFEERIQYDLFYINNWNLPMDLRIILKTVPVLFNMRAAH